MIWSLIMTLISWCLLNKLVFGVVSDHLLPMVFEESPRGFLQFQCCFSACDQYHQEHSLILLSQLFKRYCWFSYQVERMVCRISIDFWLFIVDSDRISIGCFREFSYVSTCFIIGSENFWQIYSNEKAMSSAVKLTRRNLWWTIFCY